MFEQSILDRQTLTYKPWTVAVSFTGQLLLVGIALLVPLIFTDTLQRVQFYVGIVAPPPKYSPPPLRDAAKLIQEVRRQVVAGKVFVPTHVPQRAQTIVEEMAAPELSGTGQAGVPGGIDAPGGNVSGVIANVIQSVPSITPPPPPAPKVKEAPRAEPIQRITIGGNVQEAKLIHSPQPVYPPLARSARISGVVRIAAVIGVDGTIMRIQVMSGHPLLVPAAVEAVKQWRYRPTLLNGNVVEVATEISVLFTLHQ